MEYLFIFVAFVVGGVFGALVMRNNYKHFTKTEGDVRQLILNKALSAEQKLLHIRNKLGV